MRAKVEELSEEELAGRESGAAWAKNADRESLSRASYMLRAQSKGRTIPFARLAEEITGRVMTWAEVDAWWLAATGADTRVTVERDDWYRGWRYAVRRAGS